MQTATETEEIKIVERHAYLSDQTPKVALILMLILGLVVIFLGTILFFRGSVAPLPTYFRATSQGALIPETPLDKPGISTNELLNWVTEAMMVSNTFNFVNFDRVLDTASHYYTPEGFDSYKTALNNINIPDVVINNKYVLRAIATDAPQLLLEKPFAGRYMWKIKVPMQFRYQNVRMDFQTLMDITLIVMRVPTTQSPNGVLILKYDLESKGAL